MRPLVNFQNSNFKQRHGNTNAGSGYYVMDDISVVLSKNQQDSTSTEKNNTDSKTIILPDVEKYDTKEPIELYFTNNSTDITQTYLDELNQQLSFLKANPTVHLRIGGHTDNTGNADANLLLSQQRADNTIAFLIANKIDASRLSGKGFGKTKLANDCTTLEKCSDELHEENRRSEFIVVE